MYSVRCRCCGGDNAPIIGGEHTNSDYCLEWTKRAEKTVESIRDALTHKIEAAMPPDSTPDRIALPKLERLQERQRKVDSALDLILAEIRGSAFQRASGRAESAHL